MNDNYDECYVATSIKDSLGISMMTFPSDVTIDNFSLSKGKHYLDCEITRLPLTEGSYRIGIWLAVRNECADYIDNIIKLDVADDDFFNNGRQIAPHIKGKVVLVSHKWNIE